VSVSVSVGVLVAVRDARVVVAVGSSSGSDVVPSVCVDVLVVVSTAPAVTVAVNVPLEFASLSGVPPYPTIGVCVSSVDSPPEDWLSSSVNTSAELVPTRVAPLNTRNDLRENWLPPESSFPPTVPENYSERHLNCHAHH
jgi:hypothetical protein